MIQSAGAYLGLQIHRCHCIRYLKILRVPIAPFYLKFWNFVGANTSTNFCGCLAPMAPSINRSLLYIKEKWADPVMASQNIHRYIAHALGENLILVHITRFVRIFICRSVNNSCHFKFCYDFLQCVPSHLLNKDLKPQFSHH